MKNIIFKANTRGHVDHGWLDTYHTFSFADYYDLNRIRFGALRVVNDDIVLGGEGFGTHPHDNMEIVSIPLFGALEHRDSMGNHGVIRKGEVQVMSAGTGVRHSEFNAHEEDPVNFFQIWIFPNEEDVMPRYQQMKFDIEGNRNNLVQIVSPNKNGDGLWIHQDAYLYLGIFDKDKAIDFFMKDGDNGLFVMVIEGKFSLEGHSLDRRDAIGIWDTHEIKIKAESDNARILLIEVPMK
ncbi:MAG: pirin family protein [Bacteroidales bacterium]|jgi:redox-sensitive bicupin YhaK (pirin superfamily)|nr:pirin family protein [Bacteroidales bacterium]